MKLRTSAQIVRDHRDADEACDRDWATPDGCGCGLCAQARRKITADFPGTDAGAPKGNGDAHTVTSHGVGQECPTPTISRATDDTLSVAPAPRVLTHSARGARQLSREEQFREIIAAPSEDVVGALCYLWGWLSHNERPSAPVILDRIYELATRGKKVKS